MPDLITTRESLGTKSKPAILAVPAQPGGSHSSSRESGACPRAGYGWRKLKSQLFGAVTFLSALLVLVPLLLVATDVLRLGLSSLSWTFFTELPKPAGELGGGMANACVGTFVILGLAAIVAVPAGVSGGIFLSEFGDARQRTWIRFSADVLNGAPSIVWGIVAFALIIFPMKRFSALAGTAVLGSMMIPMIMRSTDEVLRLVPNSYREAGCALGIPHWRVVVQIVLRTGWKRVIAGVLLAVGRMAGETAPLLFTAFGTRFWNHRISDPIAALPLQIFRSATAADDGWHRQAWAGALVLLLLVVTIQLVIRSLLREETSLTA